jgi:hypothetical protein
MGEKMLELTVRLWTNDIAPEGQVRQKHAHARGVVKVVVNKTHGIEDQRPTPFNSIAELGVAIEDLMIEHGIALHPSRKMKKYLRSDAA